MVNQPSAAFNRLTGTGVLHNVAAMTTRSGRALALLVLLAAAGWTGPALSETANPARALITVRTLVIDALGTRTVDTDVAHVPFGGMGLLIKKVPYGGPELSFRLAVTAGQPQEAGIAVNLSADIWPGGSSPIPPADQMSHREEATVLAPESTYLLEIDHNERSDRRIMLSISARPVAENETLSPPPESRLDSVSFDVEVARRSNGVADEPDTRAMSTMVGVAATYSSGVRIPGRSPGEQPRFVGLGISITPEKTSGKLITIRTELTGADFVDPERTTLVPIQLLDIRTVRSGTRFELPVDLAAPAAGSPPRDSADPARARVTYRVTITPRLP